VIVRKRGIAEGYGSQPSWWNKQGTNVFSIKSAASGDVGKQNRVIGRNIDLWSRERE